VILEGEERIQRIDQENEHDNAFRQRAINI